MSRNERDVQYPGSHSTYSIGSFNLYSQWQNIHFWSYLVLSLVPGLLAHIPKTPDETVMRMSSLWTNLQVQLSGQTGREGTETAQAACEINCRSSLLIYMTLHKYYQAQEANGDMALFGFMTSLCSLLQLRGHFVPFGEENYLLLTILDYFLTVC